GSTARRRQRPAAGRRGAACQAAPAARVRRPARRREGGWETSWLVVALATGVGGEAAQQLHTQAATRADQDDAHHHARPKAGLVDEIETEPAAQQPAQQRTAHEAGGVDQPLVEGTRDRRLAAHRLCRCMKTNFSNSETSCSFFRSAPTSGGTATFSSLLCSA